MARRVIRCIAKSLIAIGCTADFAAQPAHVYEFTPLVDPGDYQPSVGSKVMGRFSRLVIRRA
jgi:hypothetical protein